MFLGSFASHQNHCRTSSASVSSSSSSSSSSCQTVHRNKMEPSGRRKDLPRSLHTGAIPCHGPVQRLLPGLQRIRNNGSEVTEVGLKHPRLRFWVNFNSAHFSRLEVSLGCSEGTTWLSTGLAHSAIGPNDSQTVNSVVTFLEK